jgi:hypothetical protein
VNINDLCECLCTLYTKNAQTHTFESVMGGIFYTYTLGYNGVKCKCLMQLRPAVLELQVNAWTDILLFCIVKVEGRLDNLN